MNRIDFIKSLGLIAGASLLPSETKQEHLTLNGFHSNGIGVGRMRITSSGNVSIGCINPSAKLHISGGSIVTDSNGVMYLDGCILQAI